MLWLSYEELKANPLESVRKIASHIGCEAAAADDELLAEVSNDAYPRRAGQIRHHSHAAHPCSI